MGLFDESLLINTWIHSHEEDSEGLRVFRCEGFSFPPSRGRRRFTLGKDGMLVDEPIRARDGLSHVEGSWCMESNKLTFSYSAAELSVQSWKLVSVDAKKIVVRKIT